MKVKPIAQHEQVDPGLPGTKNVKMRMLVGPQEGARVFHMRHFEVGIGGHTPHHRHDYEHEVLILSGAGQLKADDGDKPLRAGDVVWIEPNAMHQFVNTGAEPLQFICLIPAPQDCAR
jgi:quercetin dioxygenase-like cupin family protein